MAQIIPFPFENIRFDWLNASTRQRCIFALQFVLDSVQSGEVNPHKMFIMYGTCNETERAMASAREDGRLRPGASAQAETIWSYLNLGFDAEGLTKAMCRVLDDVEERDEECKGDGSSP